MRKNPVWRRWVIALAMVIFTRHNVLAQLKPNIIVFLVDDMGWMDTSVPFWDSVTPLNRKYHTPNMERLAKEGMKFTNAYAAPVCTPSRISLITGMNAAHHRVTNWTSIPKNKPTDASDSMLIPPDWNYNGLSPVAGIAHTIYATPLPLLLNDAGYYTIHVGKAHWGSAGTPGASPYNLGFLVNIAGTAAGHPQSYLGEENYGNMPGKTTFNAVQDLNEYYGSSTFLTDALTKEAIKAMEHPVKTHQPFFLYLAHYAVHVPIQADRRYYQKYLDKGLEPKEAKYAALIEGMDKSLGDIMDFLERKNIDKHTVILFMSDNGGLSTTPARGGMAHTQNLPLKAGKGSVYEGGIREPMIIKWPGVIAAGSVTAHPVIIEDFFPTILQIAGVKNALPVQKVDGKSFLLLFKSPGTVDTARALVWHYPNKWRDFSTEAPGINFFSAIRKGNWKLVYDMKQKKTTLYDLHNDIGEHHDLSSRYPGRARYLSALLSDKLRNWNALMPHYRNSGKPVPMPDGL